MADPQSPFVNRFIAGATAPQVQVPYRPVQTQTPAPAAPAQNQGEMKRQRAFQAALMSPDMPIPPEFSTGSALGDEQERLRARYALMRDAGRSAVVERARAQGRSVTYDQAGNPVIGDMPQTPIVQAGPEGTRIAYRNGIPVGFSTPPVPPAQRSITPTAPMPAEMAQVRSRATGLAAERAAQVLRDAAIAAAAPVAATTAAAPAAAAPVAAAAAAPAVRAAVPAPRQPATPPTPVQFTPEEIMDPESAALEQQAAAVLEQERVRPIQAAADAQTREYIRTRAARIADLQKATVARDPAKIQAALDSLRMLKEPQLRQPRTATPEPAALPPSSEGYEMSQLLGARPMTSQELNRLTPRQYDELVRQDEAFKKRSEAYYEGRRQATEDFPDLFDIVAVDFDDYMREYEELSRLNPERYPPSPYDKTFTLRPRLATMERPEPIR
jgi:hypothetical protein